MTSLNPCFTVGFQLGETLKRASRARPRQRGSARGRAARAGRHHRPRAAALGLPAPALRRHEPARDDRHGDRLPAEAADRRRADDGARRHHPGADPRPAAAPAAGDRHGPRAHHPRHGRGGRDGRARRRPVCRPAGRAGGDVRACSPTRTTPTRRRCWPPCPSAPTGARAAVHPRRRARPVRPAGGLPVLAALRLRRRALPHGAAPPAPRRNSGGRCATTRSSRAGPRTGSRRHERASRPPAPSSWRGATSRATTPPGAACSRRPRTVKALAGVSFDLEAGQDAGRGRRIGLAASRRWPAWSR